MQKDYIMRIVEQFVQAILSIMRRRKNGEYKEARELVKNTSRYLLRMDIDILLLMHPDQILDHFKDYSQNIDTERCVLCADLLYELALIDEAEKREEIASRLKLLCLYLYAEGIPKEKQFQLPQYFERMTKLKEEFKDQQFSPTISNSLLSYQEFFS
jgi:hypothetical protein